jgi:hypothetical protein
VDSTETLIAVVIGNVALISLVAIVGGFVHYRRERLLTHQERIKALEMGRDLPDDKATAQLKAIFGTTSGDKYEKESGSLARTCFTTALWVAFWGFLFAGQSGVGNQAVAIAIAASTGAIGVTAMICGTILAMRTSPEPTQNLASKPRIETDAFDVVSRRG